MFSTWHLEYTPNANPKRNDTHLRVSYFVSIIILRMLGASNLRRWEHVPAVALSGISSGVVITTSIGLTIKKMETSNILEHIFELPWWRWWWRQAASLKIHTRSLEMLECTILHFYIYTIYSFGNHMLWQACESKTYSNILQFRYRPPTPIIIIIVHIGQDANVRDKFYVVQSGFAKKQPLGVWEHE